MYLVPLQNPTAPRAKEPHRFDVNVKGSCEGVLCKEYRDSIGISLSQGGRERSEAKTNTESKTEVDKHH